MATYRVEKRVAACMVEAVKGALVHLSELKIQAVERGTTDPKQLLSIYGQVRRLRLYVENCANSYQDPVALDLADEDADLLCSCMLLDIGRNERALQTPGALTESDGAWLQEKIDLLSEWCVNLSTRPVVELPRRAGGSTQKVREVLALVRQKFTSGVRPQFCGTTPERGGDDHGGHDGLNASQGMSVRGLSAGFEMSEPHVPSDLDRPSGFIGRPQPFVRNAAPDAPQGAAPPRPSRPVNVDLVRDPRLRTMTTLDLRAYDRAVADQDYRLAAVHLSSLFEAAVFDHALPRCGELGLAGSPDVWRASAVVRKLIGDLDEPRMVTLSRLSNASAIVRPGKQLRDPMVVTPEILAEMVTFSREVLARIGMLSDPAASA